MSRGLAREALLSRHKMCSPACDMSSKGTDQSASFVLFFSLFSTLALLAAIQLAATVLIFSYLMLVTASGNAPDVSAAASRGSA